MLETYSILCDSIFFICIQIIPLMDFTEPNGSKMLYSLKDGSN